MRPAAVLLDRDGVINVRRDGYVTSPEDFEMAPGAAEAIARLTRASLPIVVVTNQSMVNRGLASKETLAAIHQAMLAAITAKGGRIEAILYCPHRPDEACLCRKPRPGLLIQAAEGLGLPLSDCVLVGDSDSDVQAAAEAGCAALKIGEPGLPDLAAAADYILSA